MEWIPAGKLAYNAIDKLNNCHMCVGYPDTWHKECLPALADCKTMVACASMVW